MGRNSQNWARKEEMAAMAAEHNARVSAEYAEEIKHSIKSSEVIRETEHTVGNGTPKTEVIAADTVNALFQYKGNITTLNFASYKHPGGGYMSGAAAQEESLCHASDLYNVIKEFNEYYEYNRKNLHKGLYTNAAVYSPDIVFEKDGKTKKANVLTCAAPNNSLGIRYKSFTPEENSAVLKSRIEFVRDIVEKRGCDVLILGAFGCGVFSQDPFEVAGLFKRAFEMSDIPRIVYAVPGGRNLDAFKEVFKDV